MSEPAKTWKGVSSALWKLPAIFLLCLAWGLTAIAAYLTGGLARGAHHAAEACLDAIDQLRS